MKKATRMLMMNQNADQRTRRPDIGYTGDGEESYHGYPQRSAMRRSAYREYPDMREREEYPDEEYGDTYGSRMIRASGTINMTEPRTRKPRRNHMREMYEDDMEGDYVGEEDEQHELTEREAKQFTQRLKNTDGSTGAHWTMEQVEPLRISICPDCTKARFYAAMNMMYSDYADVFRRIGQDRPEVYAHMTKAFLDDEDAQDMKIERYIKHIAQAR